MTEYNTFGDWSGAVKRAKAAMPTARVDRFPELTALRDWYDQDCWLRYQIDLRALHGQHMRDRAGLRHKYFGAEE
jgi:hypothetical protein